MHKNLTKSIFKKNKQKKVVIIFVFLLILLFNTMSFNQLLQTNTDIKDKNGILEDINYNLEFANGESILFEGIESPLNITNTGNLYEFNQEIIISNQEELNLTYYLDDVHNWEVSNIETSVNNIQDTRNWVNNSGLITPTIFRKYQTYDSDHNYSKNENWDTKDNIIYEPNANYIRAHFQVIDFELNYDYFYVYNDSESIFWVDTGYWSDLYSPWISGDTINIGYHSDNLIERYGYHIDYYEYINDSSNYDSNFYSWGYNYQGDGAGGKNTYGIGKINNATAMYVGLYGAYVNEEEFDYTEGTFTEFYQNITIPRGKVVEAYLEFDYNAEYGIDTNDNNIYVKLNNQKIYSRGMMDIITSERTKKNVWQESGKITMDLWTNTSRIFDPIIYNQDLNLSIGLYCGGGYTYTNFDDGLLNIVWFDNISLVITTFANSSQDGINLTINSLDLFEGSQWGKSHLNLTGNWNTNPVILTINSTSPSLTFNLNTTLYGSHSDNSKLNQQNENGILYKILNNETVYWEFYHNFYMPSQYSDFEFIINKPKNWKILQVLDPTFLSIPFEGGDVGDNFIKVAKEFALYPGWWKFFATSPNFLNKSNTKMFKQGEWGDYSYVTGESTNVRTQINNSNEIPPNLALTEANLTIYDPTGTIWYEESQNPFPNGTVSFSEITFLALSTIGGQYNYTILWSNGTALGGVKSSFILTHQSSLTLLKPDDAKLDFRTEGFVGDIIPVRVYLNDIENNQSISNSIISYNWTDGTRFFTESALGIYETVVDTADLLARGLHKIIINSSKIGFFSSNITLEINLGEETNLQVLESKYNIELHANTTIRFKFSDFDGDGIDGALVNISISNESLYTIQNPGNGVYNIEFSTLFINEIGIHQLSINFSAVAYEPQYYIYQFQIIQQSVNLSAYINAQQIDENALIEAKFNEQLNISARAISNIDREYLSNGTITYISGDYEKDVPEQINLWYNTSIICSPENFSLGINLVYLRFEHANYRTSTFAFQLLINQIEINVDPVSFEDSLTAEIGETINIQIELLDPKMNVSIEDASVRYSWEYGLGTLNETTPGIYQTFIELPENLRGNFRFDLIITPDESTYQTTQYSFVVVIGDPIVNEPGFPNYLLWIIIGVLISIVSVLGVLSLRTYVYMPRKRKREADLLSKTQRFKDLKNIQAIVIVHKLSGIPIYSQSYSILEKHKKELFSGFIQAITMIGEEFVEKEVAKPESVEAEGGYGVEKMIELDFKQFYCLIADIEDMRAVFILKERSSERLKSQISHLILALNLKLSKELENWDGSLDEFEILIPEILNEYFELYYKEAFRLSTDINLIKMKKEKKLTKMEMRIINVIQSMSKDNIITNLNNIVELVSEENKNLIIDAIESLIKQKLIIPLND